MGYIWNNYKAENYFYMTESQSPYLEVWDDMSTNIGVNTGIRLDEIFIPEKFANESNKINELYLLFENDERYSDIFNVVCHMAAQTDMLRGITIDDLSSEVVREDIETGAYGKDIQDKFEKLKKEDADQICRYIAKYEHFESRETQLDAAIKCIFGDVNFYYERSTKKIYVCINKQGTEYNRGLFDLVCYFFKDIELYVKACWMGEHFGVIGVDETMQIDSVALL